MSLEFKNTALGNQPATTPNDPGTQDNPSVGSAVMHAVLRGPDSSTAYQLTARLLGTLNRQAFDPDVLTLTVTNTNPIAVSPAFTSLAKAFAVSWTLDSGSISAPISNGVTVPVLTVKN